MPPAELRLELGLILGGEFVAEFEFTAGAETPYEP
jgi:hypothetical protein